MVVVGVLADTHGLLDPAVLATMRAAGVNHILHAGDLVDGAKRLQLGDMLSQLQAVAPVTVVRGNMISGRAVTRCLRLPCTALPVSASSCTTVTVLRTTRLLSPTWCPPTAGDPRGTSSCPATHTRRGSSVIAAA